MPNSVTDFLGPYIAGRNLVWALGVQVALPSILTVVSQMLAVLNKLGLKAFINEAVPALGPLLTWICSVIFTFKNTEWAWEHPLLALLLLLPGFCLINAK